VVLSADLSDQVIDLKKKVVHRAANAARLAKEAEDAFNKINRPASSILTASISALEQPRRLSIC